MGIGPTRPAWKAGTLPLSYTRIRSTNMLTNNNTSNIYCQWNFYFFIKKSQKISKWTRKRQLCLFMLLPALLFKSTSAIICFYFSLRNRFWKFIQIIFRSLFQTLIILPYNYKSQKHTTKKTTKSRLFFLFHIKVTNLSFQI